MGAQHDLETFPEAKNWMTRELKDQFDAEISYIKSTLDYDLEEIKTYLSTIPHNDLTDVVAKIRKHCETLEQLRFQCFTSED